MKLVLIEGPGKQSSVQKYLGKGYKVVPTFGHLRDLPLRGLGVDVANNFEPSYVVEGDKKKVVERLKEEAKKADEILFATDPDREGEAIAWHAATLLNVDVNKPVRIEFNQISHDAVQKATEHPRPINIDLVNAQQARRVLDRLVGYKLTPLLCKKIQSNLSGGRVQSVTLKLVVDREREIENFKPEEYWTLTATLKKEGAKETFKASLDEGRDKIVKNKEMMDKIIADIDGAKFVATSVKRSVIYSHPSAPFTTSTMQQEAGNKLGLTSKQISSLAQGLYEGIDIEGMGKMALVTYIRTDSVRVAPEAQAMAKAYIIKNFSQEYLPKYERVFKNKKDAQDAHEAIRPISLNVTPESIKDKVPKNSYRLYKLIYDRFLASQMADASYNSLTVELDANGHKFKTTGKAMIFRGYTAVYDNTVETSEDSVESDKLPNIEEKELFDAKSLKPEQKYTKPPARFTEASLVKAMEDKGIGRPATYTQTVTILQTRHYVEKEGKQLKATELGKVVVDLLVKYFSDIMDVGFTAEMENRLDDIELGGKQWQSVIESFYGGFENELKTAFLDGSKSKVQDEVSDEICEKCGSRMVIKNGKYGKFLACPNFPTCKNTKPLEQKEPTVYVGECPKCHKRLKKLKTKTGKIFYGCEGYPDCDFKSWDIPACEKCPNCQTDMIKKVYKLKTVILCPNPKCNYSRQEKNEKDAKD